MTVLATIIARVAVILRGIAHTEMAAQVIICDSFYVVSRGCFGGPRWRLPGRHDDGLCAAELAR
jgi:hypothetical protein